MLSAGQHAPSLTHNSLLERSSTSQRERGLARDRAAPTMETCPIPQAPRMQFALWRGATNKVYAFIGPDRHSLARKLVVLDTGA